MENNPTFCRFVPAGVVAAVVADTVAVAVAGAVKAGKRAVGKRSRDEEDGDGEDDIELGARVGARRLNRRSARLLLLLLLLLLTSGSALSTVEGECFESLPGCCCFCSLDVVTVTEVPFALSDGLDSLLWDLLEAGERTEERWGSS